MFCSSSFWFDFYYTLGKFFFMLFATKCVCLCVRDSQPGRECVSQLRGTEHSGLTDRLSACLSKGQWELSSSNPPHTTWISHSDSMPLLWIICCQGNFTLTHTRGPSALTVCVCTERAIWWLMVIDVAPRGWKSTHTHIHCPPCARHLPGWSPSIG